MRWQLSTDSGGDFTVLHEIFCGGKRASAAIKETDSGRPLSSTALSKQRLIWSKSVLTQTRNKPLYRTHQSCARNIIATAAQMIYPKTHSCPPVKKSCYEGGKDVCSGKKETIPCPPATCAKQTKSCCDSEKDVCNEKKETAPSRQTKSCREKEMSNGENQLSPYPPASCANQTKSCCDSEKEVFSRENQTSPCTSSCTKQPCVEPADPSRQESTCNSKCCSGVVDEVGRDQLLPSDCNSQQKPQLQNEDTCCDKTPRHAATLDSSPRRGCCPGNETSQSDTSESAVTSRRTTPDCCEERCRDDCCSPCQSSCSCTDKDSVRPSSLAGASSVSTCCDTGSSCSHAKLPDVTCQSRNPAIAVTCSPPEDKCCAMDFTRPPPPPTPRGIQKSDSGEKKPLVQQNTTKLRVQNICCAMESKLVQESLEPLEGVVSIAVNVIGRVVYVRHDPEVTSATELVNTLNRVHLGASIMETGSHQHGEESERLPPSLSSFLIYLLIQTILLIVATVAFFSGASWYQWVAIAEIVFGIAPVLKKAYVSFKTCSVDINILMLIAIAGTLAIQEWLEGAAVVYVFSLAEALQEFCMYKVQRTISGLMLKAPQVAILASTGECVPVEAVTIGTAIAIRPGELIPLDGDVVKGRAAVDESSVSGESVPVEKTVGSKVFSGTVNQNGYLEVETTSDSTTSTVSKVAQLVQEAQTGSARTEVAINRFAKYYTPAVVIVAALVVVIPAILGAAGVGTYSQELKEWGRRALVMLVIACPCALVMSTPIAVVCGITAAARKGALIKGGVHLETLAQLQVLAFDKTGTLTEGKFQVVDIECTFGVHERAALRLAAALESKSSHPLAAAVVNEFAGCVAEMVKSQSATLPEVSRFELREGQGISGVVDGHLVQIGNYEFLHRIGGVQELNKFMESKYVTWSNESKTVIFVCVDGKLAMMIALADIIRPNSLASLNWLRKLRVQSAMITGDNSRTAMAVKSKLGLDECIAEMKPHDKLSWIKERQEGMQGTECEVFSDDQESTRRFLPSGCSRRRRYITAKSRDSNKSIVGMVGDGVNDGPALAAANIGIAMGAGGTALAVEAADVALMSNNLAKIPELVELGRFCRRVVAENISFSVVLKLAIVIAALAGKATLWMAVLADVLGLLFVIMNGLRPLWWKIAKKDDSKNTDVELAFAKNARPIYSYESYV
ncbi:hypothetical protein ACROYT_G002995 [Oculina patagonica]